MFIIEGDFMDKYNSSSIDSTAVNLLVVIILFFAGCFVGKYFMEKYNSGIVFNVVSISILVLGEMVGCCIKKRISRTNTNILH